MTRLGFLLGLMLLIACNTDKKAASSLNSSLLPSSFITIQPGKDTIIKTAKGATITIAAGTFEKPVELEIKEAYTMADILLGGLVTESDGRLLSSDGMIYINTANKEDLKLNKPIGISMPAYIDPNMKLFKGSEQSDGVINWTNPTNLVSDTPKNGRLMFQNLCANCHRVRKDLVGPALAGARERAPDSSSFYEFIRNSPKVLASGNPYYVALFERYNKIPQNLFPELDNAAIDEIMKYVEWAAKNLSRYVSENVANSDTSQARPEGGYQVPDTMQSAEGDTTMYDTTITFDAKSWEQALRYGFTDRLIGLDSYTFEIRTLGWYNIDAYVQGLSGTTLCDLKVDLTSDLKERPSFMNVYMFVPARKNLSVGVMHEDGRYYFEKSEGKIPLFLKDKAFVLAFGNINDEFFYGITGFTTKPEQVKKIKVLKTTREDFLKQVRSLKFEGIQFDSFVE